jgi:hypothetical protein
MTDVTQSLSQIESGDSVAAEELLLSLSFLGPSAYGALLVRDQHSDLTAVTVEKVKLTSADTLQIELADGGGFIGRFSPEAPPVFGKWGRP